MFNRILICSDLSAASDILLNCVEDYKDIGVEEVILAHIVYVVNMPGLEEKYIEEAKPKLEEKRAIFEEVGIKTKVEIRHGIPAYEINEIAEEYNVSAIVIGSHGKGIAKRLTLGSVSSEVISTANVPVFLVKIKLDEQTDKVVLACQKLINHVLYLTDFSKTADEALEYLEEIVQETKCLVTVMHIWNSQGLNDYLGRPELETREIDKALNIKAEKIKNDLEAIRARLENAGSREVRVKYVTGKPINMVINEINNSKDFSLVVLGSHGMGFVKKLFLGSLALQVSRYSPIPVLLIPTKLRD